MPVSSFFASRVLQPVSPTPGESGYFSAPEQSLDPDLFDGEMIQPSVRSFILNTLYSFWGPRYKNARDWSTVWIAGSGISYQWAASRGNGDLDVLIGVDWDDFYNDNPQFRGFGEKDLAEIINQEFHQSLWPTTANTTFGSKAFEVTFYVNPGATDIRAIHPYAAYDLTSDSWTVRPPTGSAFLHPQEFYKSAEDEANQARDLTSRYNALAATQSRLQPGSPGWLNATHGAGLVASQAAALYDSIHLGRKEAFGPSGSGYGDYYNFRWQYHKQQGTAQALHAVGEAHRHSQESYAEQVYGGPIDAADVALRRAAMVNR